MTIIIILKDYITGHTQEVFNLEKILSQAFKPAKTKRLRTALFMVDVELRDGNHRRDFTIFFF